jgi:tRNA-binding EMAP/Myf-like protein
MSYCGYIAYIKNIRPHPNADRLNLGEVFGNTVVISKEYLEGVPYIYFPVDGQLSEEYANANDLVRRKDEAGNAAGGFLEPGKRNIRAIKLRGEKSDGLVMPLSSLDKFGDITTLNIGDTITVFNGHEICCKYIPRSNNHRRSSGSSAAGKKPKVKIAPLFKEHIDTEQLAYNLNAFKSEDEIEITLKMHGTSGRTGYLPRLVGFKRTIWDKLTRKPGTPIYEYGYVSGTRRTVLENYDGGYYGSNEFREPHSKFFEGKLWKNETVYYEIVGFTHDGKPIMSDANNKKTNDKNFIKQYGETTTFSYGCHPNGWNDKDGGYNSGRNEPQSDIYVYRMTMTNEDGNVVEYTPDFMRYRCEQMGVKTVPVMWRGTIPAEEVFTGTSCEYTDPGEWIKNKAEEFCDGPDPIGKTHVREGVVVRIINRPNFAAYKHKNFYFKVLEGIIKDVAEKPDMEEADGLDE